MIINEGNRIHKGDLHKIDVACELMLENLGILSPCAPRRTRNGIRSRIQLGAMDEYTSQYSPRDVWELIICLSSVWTKKSQRRMMPLCLKRKHREGRYNQGVIVLPDDTSFAGIIQPIQSAMWLSIRKELTGSSEKYVHHRYDRISWMLGHNQREYGTIKVQTCKDLKVT